jgi:pyruvate/2-oxoglutarate dehydrogenase complex dihydrolipoamide acyltransferase (E2) component
MSRISTYPEHVEMPMPRLVPTMESGILKKWLVNVGDEIQERFSMI